MAHAGSLHTGCTMAHCAGTYKGEDVYKRQPKDIATLEERLLTRFEWGLTADIQPPDFETRIAIIKRKAELLGIDLPNNVIEYIANRLKNNIRQLEGTVKKMKAYYLLNGDALNPVSYTHLSRRSAAHPAPPARNPAHAAPRRAAAR